MTGLRPNVSNQTSLWITSNWIFEQISQLVLPVRNVLSLLVTEGNNNLFQERKRLVDKLGFNQSFSFRACFFSSLRSSQINQVDLTHNNFFTTLNSTSSFQMQSKYTMTPATSNIQFMLSNSSIILSLKKHLQSFLLIFANFFCQSFYKYVTFLILLNCKTCFVAMVKQK